MEITILGSGGNAITPMPTCKCRVCTLARERGGRDVRYGNCTFVHDGNILIDAPEHIFYQLNHHDIEKVDHLLISHWHPDHTAGIRILQALGNLLVTRRPDHLRVYLTETTRQLMTEHVTAALDHYVETTGAELVIIEPGETYRLGPVSMRILAGPEHAGGEDRISYFLLEQDGKRALIAPDETKYLDLAQVPELDLLVKECGFFSHAVDGSQLIPDETLAHLTDEIRFEETVEQIKAITPKRTVLTELEELFCRTPEDYDALAEQYADLNLEFAYDGMRIRI